MSMEPIKGEKAFISRIDEFDKKISSDDKEIQEIRQLILDNLDSLLILDKPVLSNLTVKLINGGVAKEDSVIDKIQQVVSAWRNDLRDIFKDVSKGLDLIQKLSTLKENEKMVIYRHRMGGDYQISVEMEKPLSSSPWNIASSVGTFALYQKFESVDDVLKILIPIQKKLSQDINQLLKELSEKNISNDDFEKGLELLTSIHSFLPHAIEALNNAGPNPLIEEERIFLIELSLILTPKRLNNLVLDKERGYSLPDDVVCEFSQGRLTDVRNAIGIKNEDDDNQGSLACAVICMKAAQSFFDKGIPKSEKEIYTLIDHGVTQYKKDQYNGLVLFEDVLNKLSAEDQGKTESVALNMEDGIDESAAMAFQFTGEFAGSVNLYLDSILNAVQNKADSSDLKTCAVLTTQSPKGTNATLVIMFDEDKKPVLFNSHGETYEGELKGASALHFDDMNELNAYLKKTFFKNEEGQFQLRVLRELVH